MRKSLSRELPHEICDGSRTLSTLKSRRFDLLAVTFSLSSRQKQFDITTLTSSRLPFERGRLAFTRYRFLSRIALWLQLARPATVFRCSPFAFQCSLFCNYFSSTQGRTEHRSTDGDPIDEFRTQTLSDPSKRRSTLRADQNAQSKGTPDSINLWARPISETELTEMYDLFSIKAYKIKSLSNAWLKEDSLRFLSNSQCSYRSIEGDKSPRHSFVTFFGNSLGSFLILKEKLNVAKVRELREMIEANREWKVKNIGRIGEILLLWLKL